MAARQETGMDHLYSLETAWQLSKDRRQRLIDSSTRWHVPRRPRPRPPRDDLLRPTSPGGRRPPAA